MAKSSTQSKLWKKAKKGFKGMEKDFKKSPLARAAGGRRTRGYL